MFQMLSTRNLILVLIDVRPDEEQAKKRWVPHSLRRFYVRNNIVVELTFAKILFWSKIVPWVRCLNAAEAAF
jgi:hypothetical protein